METRKIGSLDVSLAGLGCNNFGWRIDAQATATVVDAAIEAGINFFDTADIYGKGQSEEYLGKALGSRRKDVLVATKFGMKMDEENFGAQARTALGIGRKHVECFASRSSKAIFGRTGVSRHEVFALRKFRSISSISFGTIECLIGGTDEVIGGAARFTYCS
jgi:aryl-alcohol dehydrogenase-like predicted oxidoreductase